MNEENYAGFYDDAFYKWQSTGSYKSAKVVTELVSQFLKPNSVVDLGCGVGAWLKAFQESGAETIQGYDGSWVNQENLLIPKECFSSCDLSMPIANQKSRFDLAISVEVAEHLPESAADNFVASLCNLSPVVLFSAATPGQGGKNHINEQWQSYWAKKFLLLGYEPFDIIRPSILGHANVDWWYQQNLILYIQRNHNLATSLSMWRRNPEQLDMVHPLVYMDAYRKAYRPKLRELLKKIPSAFVQDIYRKLNKRKNKHVR